MSIKIFDCFTFYNELDILELRLKEHWDYVDYFVISEANRTHQNRPKEFILENNWDKFKEFHDKIIHIKVTDMPSEDPNPWTREVFQRNTLARGLALANENDIVAVSDVDEIVRSSTWQQMRSDAEHNQWACYSPFFQFRLNFLLVSMPMPYFYMPAMMAARKHINLPPQKIRESRELVIQNLPHKIAVMHHAGWHFSFIGNNEFAKNKYLNFAPIEASYFSDIVDIEKCLRTKTGVVPLIQEKFECVEMDDYFPNTILTDMDRWSDFIVKDTNGRLDKNCNIYKQPNVTMFSATELNQMYIQLVKNYSKLEY